MVAYAARAEQSGVAAWAAYERFARLCRSLAGDAADLGVTVLTRVRLMDFLETLATHETVTLLAHARGPDIRESDILDVARVRDAAHALMARFGTPECLPLTAKGLALHLNGALGEDDTSDADTDALSDAELFARRTASYGRRAEMRRCLEVAADGALLGGPGVEFCDGLVRNEELSDRIPRVPTLDLTVCDSVLLAECIRDRHSDGVILSNPRPTTPDFRLALYREAVRHSLKYDQPYPDAVMQIRRQLKGSRSHDVHRFSR